MFLTSLFKLAYVIGVPFPRIRLCHATNSRIDCRVSSEFTVGRTEQGRVGIQELRRWLIQKWISEYDKRRVTNNLSQTETRKKERFQERRPAQPSVIARLFTS